MTGWGLREGDAITDDLVAVRRLGGGATYEAYLAFDEVTWGPVVTKLVRPDLVEDASSLRGLRREAAALAAVNHPVVVRGLRWTDEGPRPHLVLENLDGPRLSTLVRRHGRLQPQQYLVLGIELASALHYLRRLGWVHLDVKPSNIIMGAPARLIDLSVARTIEDAARLKHVIGTDRYLAPEQADPGRAGVPGPASDVWGLAAVLFEAVSGVRPFRDGPARAAPPARRGTGRPARRRTCAGAGGRPRRALPGARGPAAPARGLRGARARAARAPRPAAGGLALLRDRPRTSDTRRPPTATRPSGVVASAVASDQVAKR